MSWQKRGLQLFLVVLATALLASTIYAEESVYDSDTAVSGESIDIDDFNFIINLNKYGNAIFVKAGDMFQTVQITKCKDMEQFRVCFYNVTYDEDENDLLMDIEIFRRKPDISITKVINQTEFYVGQSAEVTITVTNTADNAEQVIITDDYPVSVEIYDLEGGCQFHEGEVYWQGHIDEDETQECTFKVKVLDDIHKSLSAKVEYWDGYKWLEEYSSTTTLDVMPTLSVESIILRENYEVDGQPSIFDYDDDNSDGFIGETIKLLLNVSNNYNERVDIDSLKINLPSSLKFVSVGHLRFNFNNATGNRSSVIWKSDSVKSSSSNEVEWSGSISSNGTGKLFILNLLAERTGIHNINTNIDYTFDKMTDSQSEQESVTIVDPGVAIRVTVYDPSKRFTAPVRLSDSDEDEDNIDIEALHKYRFTVYAQNINPFIDIEDVHIKFNTSIVNFKDVFLDSILAGKQRIPYSEEIIPQQVSSDTSYKSNISISYKNEFGESHQNSTELTFKVNKFEDITINVESSEGTTLDGNEETEIIVSLKNDRLVDLPDVYVKDIIPEGFQVDGAHSNRLKLNRETDTQVYKYRLTPDIVRNKTTLNLITAVTFFDKDLGQEFNITENTSFTINVLKPDLSVTASYDEPTDIQVGSLIPVSYDISNSEDAEVIKDITVLFPLSPDWDLIGPKSFYVDVLDPGESTELQNVITIRPKVHNKSLSLNETVVQYHDSYGNMFTENESEEKFEVVSALISGPALFAKTQVEDEIINLSSNTKVKVTIQNNGDTGTDATVSQGEHVWNITLAAGETKLLTYSTDYKKTGNFSVDAPVIKFDYFGQEAYTLGEGSAVQVVELMSVSEQEALAEEVAAAEATAETDKGVKKTPEPVEMSFEEWAETAQSEFKGRAFKYVIYGLIAVAILAVIFIYVYFKQNSAPDVTFANEEENGEETNEEGEDEEFVNPQAR